MKRPITALLLLSLFVCSFLLSACTKSTKEWWLEMNYLDEKQGIDVSMNMPITINDDDTLSGNGMLQIRHTIQGDTTGYPECLAGETNGARVTGEIVVFGTFRDNKIYVESLEPTGGPGDFTIVFYCVKDKVERDVKKLGMDSNSAAGAIYSNAVIDALYIFSEGMLKNPMDLQDNFSGTDGKGFTFTLHRGTLPESKLVPTPNINPQ